MVHITIFDDNPQSIASLRTLVEANMPPSESCRVDCASTLEELYGFLDKGRQPDILLADIVMPEGQPSGIDIVRDIFPPESGTQVIYVSAYLAMAPEVYTTSHVYFLLKPIDPAKLSDALAKACVALKRHRPPMLRIKTGHKERLLNVATIAYLESRGRVAYVHCRGAVYTTYAKLDELLATLPPSFSRCHRSFVVNLAFVSSLDEDEAVLHDGTHVPVSRRRARQVQHDLLAYLGTRTRG